MSEHIRRFVEAVRARGVDVRAPETLDVTPEVDATRFEAGAVLHGGTRLRGADTCVLADAVIGEEAPATLVNARVGRRARVKGGYVEGAVLLDDAEIGSGAHVRGGTLLEEGARAAHTVGLKQTILLPWATLGSLINLCDCLLAGGTAPRDHSEIGSGVIHFNFTPRGPKGDKATPSLFGDVPRGVLLDQPRVFVGGDSGLVGPMKVGFGAVLAAGCTYRRDCPDGVLRTGEVLPAQDIAFDPLVYGDVTRKWRLNLEYVGNLLALRRWYVDVRQPRVPAGDAPGRALLDDAVQLLDGAIAERTKRMGDLAAALELSLERLPAGHRARESQKHVVAQWPRFREWIGSYDGGSTGEARERFLALWAACEGDDHPTRVRALSPEGRTAATDWLGGVVETAMREGTHLS